MFQEPKFLSAEQFLLTTLIVKLAVVAVQSSIRTVPGLAEERVEERVPRRAS